MGRAIWGSIVPPCCSATAILELNICCPPSHEISFLLGCDAGVVAKVNQNPAINLVSSCKFQIFCSISLESGISGKTVSSTKWEKLGLTRSGLRKLKDILQKVNCMLITLRV